MFSKVITLLFFATCAVAQLPTGTYQIFNIQPEFRDIPVHGRTDPQANVTIPSPKLPPSDCDMVSCVITM
jgi:hypothetical protein